ncbi:hypothetical protein [Burkholderia pseudomallei]|uniref:hypothetical protein n=1 Tax=Burkholderia pseudomallei TaxID=28450 RepID=UPI0021F77A99|nr:hypothetical protein [Burkholderia pseudomallei]MCW0014690.1 hypothetical protein [Burkholderia pseudomallei]
MREKREKRIEKNKRKRGEEEINGIKKGERNGEKEAEEDDEVVIVVFEGQESK